MSNSRSVLGSCLRAVLALGLLIGRLIQPVMDRVWPDVSYTSDQWTLGAALACFVICLAVLVDASLACDSITSSRFRRARVRAIMSWVGLATSIVVVVLMPA